jgi:uncharacterized membrane protein
MADPRSAEQPEDALPPHVEETARAVEELRSEHRSNATPLERALDRIKMQASAPAFVVVAICVVSLWIAANTFFPKLFDAPPFAYLQLALSALAFFATILILATQRRADMLAGHREQLILQLAFVSEQKTAKIIGLLEELRRDSPELKDRVDEVAVQMTETVNARAMSDALRGAAGSESKS